MFGGGSTRAIFLPYVVFVVLVVSAMHVWYTYYPNVSACPVQIIGPSTGRLGSCAQNKTDTLDALLQGFTGPDIKPDNEQLIKILKDHVIDPPSPYMAKMSYPLFTTPQAEAVDKILKKKTNGFFVECGGMDGERSSNTIFFEQQRKWNGLLIEMDPSWYLQILGKNRRSHSINACISPYAYPIKIHFEEHQMGEGRLIEESSPKSGHIRQVHCYPLFTMMLALGQTHIDYFSLDVEGVELEILKTIPFDKLDISVLTVEHKHGKGGERAYVEFMEKQGYYKHSRVEMYKPEIYFGCNDLVFVKRGATF